MFFHSCSRTRLCNQISKFECQTKIVQICSVCTILFPAMASLHIMHVKSPNYLPWLFLDRITRVGWWSLDPPCPKCKVGAIAFVDLWFLFGSTHIWGQYSTSTPIQRRSWTFFLSSSIRSGRVKPNHPSLLVPDISSIRYPMWGVKIGEGLERLWSPRGLMIDNRWNQ